MTKPLPLPALLALTTTGFVCIATEILPAGLLPQIAEGLSISPTLAGQTVTIFALGAVLAPIPLTLLTRHWPRRHVLLLSVLGFCTFNTLTALAPTYSLILFARFMAGAANGLAWSLLAAYARRLVPPSQHGRALAVVMAGNPIALSFGVPLGTWLGTVLTWRLTFGTLSLTALILTGWIIASVPNYQAPPSRTKTPLKTALTTPGVRPVLTVVLLWVLAHTILYTYISPFLTLSNLQPHTDTLLLIFGLASIAGLWTSGLLIDRALRATVLASLAIFTALSLALSICPTSPIIVIIAITLWGLTFGGAAALLQTALANTAGHNADIALSANVVVWNGAVAAGGLIGGLLLPFTGVQSLSWAVTTLSLSALLTVTAFRRHGFPKEQ